MPKWFYRIYHPSGKVTIYSVSEPKFEIERLFQLMKESSLSQKEFYFRFVNPLGLLDEVLNLKKKKK